MNQINLIVIAPTRLCVCVRVCVCERERVHYVNLGGHGSYRLDGI